MKIEVLADADAVAQRGAEWIAAAAREAVGARGQFTFAVSGGRTPWRMLELLGEETLPWDAVHVLQVDERVAPADDRDRNSLHLRETLLARAALSPQQVHAMPVEAPDLAAAAARYAHVLEEVAGSPPVLDLVHLGLGTDGHTASLVPGDPVLETRNVDVAVTGVYQGHRRMTLTFPVLARARQILWLVTGTSKAEMLLRLRDGDKSIPAARVRRDRARVLVDEAAAEGLQGRLAAAP